MRFRPTTKVISLYSSGEALTFRNTYDVNPITGFKNTYIHLLSYF